MGAINKQGFIHACNNLDGDDFIREAHIYLQEVNLADNLNEFIDIFGAIFKIKKIFASEELNSLCELIRDKVYEIQLSKGEIPENNIARLYGYYRLCYLAEDSRFVAYEHFVEQNLYADGISDTERAFLIILGFFASMANSRNDSYEKFLMSSMKLNFMEIEHISFSTFMSGFINDIDIDINETFDILKKIWNKESYFALNKTVRRSVFNWSFHSLWGVDKYFNHPLWMIFYPLWKDIFYEHIARDECDEAMYVHFFIYHKMGNSFQTQEEWKMFNDDIDRPASEYYKQWALKTNLLTCKTTQSESKKIIGFLWDRVVENSPFKVAYSLWKALYESSEFRSRYEIKIYLMSYFEKSNNDQECMDNIRRLGIEIFDGAEPFYADGFYHSHLDKAIYIRQKMIDDGVDIMVHGASYDINDFLVTTRTAPKQIYWSHGNFEYDVYGIDKKISHILGSLKFKMDKNGHIYSGFAIPMDLKFYNQPVHEQIIKNERSKYPEDVFILGTIGRLVKVDSNEYLEAVAQILKKTPNTIYIAAGGGNFDSIKNKLDKLGIMDRVYMPGHVDAHLYGNIIDFWLDTFPLHGGEAVSEFAYKQKCIINYYQPNKNRESISDEDYIKYQSMVSKFNHNPMFAYLQDFNVSKEHALHKISQLLKEVDEIIFVVNSFEEYNFLIESEKVQKEKLLLLDSNSSTSLFNFLIDLSISLYGENDIVDTVQMEQFFIDSYRCIKSTWIVLYDDFKYASPVALRHSECSINGYWHNHFTIACSPKEYIEKANYLIQNSDFRNKVIYARNQEFQITRKSAYESIENWLTDDE